MPSKRPKTGKSNLVNEYYVIFVADSTTDEGRITVPVFEKVLKRDLVKLGGIKKFDKVPSGPYKSKAGLIHNFRRDSQGLVWKDVVGTVRGATYESSVLVDPELGGNEVVITTTAIVKAQVAGKVTLQQEKIGLTFTPSLNKEQVMTWAKEVLEPAGKAMAIRAGKDTMLLAKGVAEVAKAAKKNVDERRKSKGKSKGKTQKALPASNSPGNNISVPTYIPLGTVKAGKKLKKDGGIDTRGGAATSTIIYAVIYEESAIVMGLSAVKEATAKEIESGTKLDISKSQGSGKFKRFSVFAKPRRYTQVWTDVSSKNDETKTPISNSGTGIKVKLRYTRNSAGSTSISSNSEYAYFSVPSGTPVAFIAESMMQLQSRPRSFQISTGGTNYGKSYTLPSRSAKLKE